MTQGLSILEIITIITAFQLLMLGMVLLSKRSIKRVSNRILAAFMFSNAMVLIHFLLSTLNIVKVPAIPVFYYLLAPLIYLYVRAMCDTEFKIGRSFWVHGMIFLAMVLLVILKPLVSLDNVSTNWNSKEYILSQLILHIQIFSYIIFSWISITKYRTNIKNHYSSVEEINLSWLMIIILAFATMWLTDLAAFIFSFFRGTDMVNQYLVIVSITINLLFANYLVYRGLRQADALSGIKAPAKYIGSKMPEEESTKLVGELKELMYMEKPYLNPDLTIKDLSENFDIHPKFLSQVINSRFGQNFYDFVNHYRIEEAKKIMRENFDEKKTILEILYEVGFNSKSAFNNAFKKNTGTTPTEFKRTG